MRLYESDDYAALKSWFQARGVSAPAPSALPRLGVIVDGIAAGFLIQTDTSIACIDFYISNPEIEPHRRDHALDLITKALLKHAKRLGFKYVKSTTYLDVIAKRAKAHGFNEVGMFRTFVRGV